MLILRPKPMGENRFLRRTVITGLSLFVLLVGIVVTSKITHFSSNIDKLTGEVAGIFFTGKFLDSQILGSVSASGNPAPYQEVGGSVAISGKVGIDTASLNSQLSIGAVGSFTNLSTELGVRGDALGNTAGNYSYPAEIQVPGATGNTQRLQFATYRRASGTDWKSSAYRLQFAVDSSFTDGSKAYLEIGGDDPNTSGGGFISLGTAASDRLSITNAGRVGINTVSPTTTLEVNGTMKVDGSTEIVGTTLFDDNVTIASSKGVYWGSADSLTTYWYLPRRGGTGTCTTLASSYAGIQIKDLTGATRVGAICLDGSGADNYLHFFARDFNSTGTDLAEGYSDTTNTLNPGDLVVLDPATFKGIKKSAGPYEKNLMGVISTAPGLNMTGVEANGKTDLVNPKPVALRGRVPTKVSTINGPIQKGDFLTSSSIPGVAMKAIKAGTVIGQALETYNDPDTTKTGTIEVNINVSLADPVGSIKEQQAEIKSLQTENANLKSQLQTLESRIQALEVKVQ